MFFGTATPLNDDVGEERLGIDALAENHALAGGDLISRQKSLGLGGAERRALVQRHDHDGVLALDALEAGVQDLTARLLHLIGETLEFVLQESEAVSDVGHVISPSGR